MINKFPLSLAANIQHFINVKSILFFFRQKEQKFALSDYFC